MFVAVRLLAVVPLVIRSTFITTRAVIVSPPVVVDVESSETPRPATVGTDQGAATASPMAAVPPHPAPGLPEHRLARRDVGGRHRSRSGRPRNQAGRSPRSSTGAARTGPP